MFLAWLFCCLNKLLCVLYATILLFSVDFRKRILKTSAFQSSHAPPLLPKTAELNFGGCKNGNVGNEVLKRKVSQ